MIMKLLHYLNYNKSLRKNRLAKKETFPGFSLCTSLGRLVQSLFVADFDELVAVVDRDRTRAEFVEI